MIDIYTTTGERYSFDEDTERIFKDGKLLPSSIAEPVYQGLQDDNVPTFAGILLKNIDSILSSNGNINKLTDVNTL